MPVMMKFVLIIKVTSNYVRGLFNCIKEFIMNPIANMSHVLRKYKGRPIPLDHEFGEAPMYCGWGNRRLGLSSSPLANPYTEKSNARQGRIRVASRDEAIEMYRRWLWKQICADNQQVLEELHQVTPTTTLICWCTPKRCHCEVISCAADWLRKQTSRKFNEKIYKGGN